MDWTQILAIAIVGGVASHLYSKHKLLQFKRAAMFRHVMSMTALADAAIEVMAVDYDVPVEVALKKLHAKATELNPGLIGMERPQIQPDAQARIDKLRKEKYGDKKPD